MGDSDEGIVGLAVGLTVGKSDGLLEKSSVLVGIELEVKVGDADETPVGVALGGKDWPGSSVGEGVHSPSRTFHKSP